MPSASPKPPAVYRSAWTAGQWRRYGRTKAAYPASISTKRERPCEDKTQRPTPANRRSFHYTFFFAEGVTDEEITATINSSNTILDEDRLICEAVQRNMESGLYQGGLLSPRHEGGVAFVQAQVLAALQAFDGVS